MLFSIGAERDAAEGVTKHVSKQEDAWDAWTCSIARQAEPALATAVRASAPPGAAGPAGGHLLVVAQEHFMSNPLRLQRAELSEAV